VEKNDVSEKIENKIDNTSVTSDLNGVVNTTFKLTPKSTRIATSWNITINGQPVSSTNIPNLTVSGSKLSGSVEDAYLNKDYKVMVVASDSAGEIDSREFTLVPKRGTKDDTVKFLFPLPGGAVTCKFGPRKPPAPGASTMHKGIDISSPGNKLGDIVSTADGIVVAAGPARGFGNWIKIEHYDAQNRLVATSVYGHMNEWYVKVGQKVAGGQKIAKEGNAGIGSGAHLHFEIHKGSWGNPTDPLPYINGNFSAADNNLPGKNGEPDTSTTQRVNQTNVGMTAKEAEVANRDCPDELPNQSPPTSVTNPEPIYPPPPPQNNDAPNKSACKPNEKMPADKVRAEMDRAFAEEPSLTAEDRKFLIQVATIESNLDPYAKNRGSSATGLYQMLDKTAVKYYGVIGIPATCENRCNPYYATKAMIKFYTQEFRTYWAGYLESGKTKIANKAIKPTTWSAKYASFTQGEFMYGLIHHDGVGNAVAGVDRQGVDYWRRKIRA
jgi:murein DD-endopeptidase MepM/ murein hydrolase activator NlpD